MLAIITDVIACTIVVVLTWGYIQAEKATTKEVLRKNSWAFARALDLDYDTRCGIVEIKASETGVCLKRYVSVEKAKEFEGTDFYARVIALAR